ncbi:MAG: LemA family protein [Bacteroidales bacterium]|nr:LemA family protein [Bacteroidales bacterium]
MIVGLIILALILIISIIFISIYNKLVRLRNYYKNAYAQIDVQLKRRYDLIPNLVESVKGYLQHERNTLETVIKARNQAMSAANIAASNPGDPSAMQNLAKAEGELAGALSRLMVVFEQYPNLKANESINSLMEELTTTENKIAFARQAYNDSIYAYKNAREVFPNNIVATMFNFGDAEYLEAVESPEERKAPKVQF